MTIISEPHSLTDALDTFKGYLARYNPEDVWFFVENRAIKDAVVSQLGIPVLGSHIATLQEFATHLAAERCRDRTFLKTEEQLILFHDIVCSSGWNAANTSIPFVYELLGRYNFFCKNGISLEPYRSVSQKHEILADVFARYQETCGTSYMDSISILQAAAGLVQTANPVKAAVIYHVTPADVLQQQLKDAICTSSENSEITEYQMPEFRIEAPAVLTCPIFKYSTARAEAEAVLDQAAALIETGCSPSDILILTPSLPETSQIIRDCIGDFYYRSEDGEYLPVACTSVRIPYSSFPIIQCVMAALSTQLSGYRLADLETVTSSKYFPWPEENYTEYLTADRLRELSIVANVTEKEQAWQSAAFRLQNDAKLKFDAARIEPLLSWLKQIASSSKTQTVAKRVHRLRQWLSGSGWTTVSVSVQENKVREGFLQYLDRIAGAASGQISCSLAEFTALLRQYIHTAAVTVPARNGIRLQKLRNAADLQAKHVFIVGLTADNLPKLTPALSPFSAAETAELCRLPDGTPFSLTDRQYAEACRNFAAALHTATESLHLSCYLSNGSNSSAPSSLLTRLGDPQTAPVSVITHSVWHNQTAAGTRIRTACETADDTPLLGIPDTAKLAAVLDREQNGYTSDFSATPVKALFEEMYAAREYYPTEIEKYIACPYRWYLDMHLRLRNPQDTHSEHMQLGNLVHAALQDFFTNVSAERLKTEAFDTLYNELLACLHARFDAEKILDSPS